MRTKPVVTCAHPERPHAALGLCRLCYDILWIGVNPELHAAHNATKKQKKQARAAVVHATKMAILAAQGGCCALCKRTSVGGWHWDHNHMTKEMRSVLCTKCNNGLGFFNDDPDMLWRAAAYLASYERRSPAADFLAQMTGGDHDHD